MAAAMNFFEHQEQARKRAGLLVLFFILAVLGIVAGVYLVVSLVLTVGLRPEGAVDSANWPWGALWDGERFAIVAGATLLVVGGGSLYKAMQLRHGGAALAAQLGGIEVRHNTTDWREKRLLNVVEEMAIASGVPMPTVFVLPKEDGINAFAAGTSVDDAVVAVTRGSLEHLSRDELQGVIGHELSHVLNGDMRLNLHLIGLVHGILLIGLIGYHTLRVLGRGRVRGGKKAGGAIAAIFAIALGLMIVGFAGTFFGNLIKAAVSRQREFLADASAVQFTRNPRGLAAALKRIGLHTARLETPFAPQLSHMFIARAVESGIAGLFSTHPRLDARIERIAPNWDGELPAPAGPDRAEALPAAPPRAEHGRAFAAGHSALAPAAAAGLAPALAGLTPPSAALASALAPTVARESIGEPALARAGRPGAEHLAYAQRLLASLPAAYLDCARSPQGARAMAYALLCDDRPEVRGRQMAHLAAREPPAAVEAVAGLLELRAGVPAEARLPLVQLALPALRSLSPAEQQAFIANLDELARADQRISLLEWTVRRSVTSHLRATAAGRPTVRSLGGLESQLALVLSTVARAGQSGQPNVELAFEAGAVALGLAGLALLPPAECRLDTLGAALDRLAAVAPLPKQQILRAVAAVIAFDRQVTVAEGELLRAIADTLAVPMPPLLPGQPLA